MTEIEKLIEKLDANIVCCTSREARAVHYNQFAADVVRLVLPEKTPWMEYMRSIIIKSTAKSAGIEVKEENDGD